MHTPHRTCNEEDIDHAAASQCVVIFVMASLHVAERREEMLLPHRTCNEAEDIYILRPLSLPSFFLMASLHVADLTEGEKCILLTGRAMKGKIIYPTASQFVVIFMMASLHVADRREKMHTSHRTCNEGDI